MNGPVAAKFNSPGTHLERGIATDERNAAMTKAEEAAVKNAMKKLKKLY